MRRFIETHFGFVLMLSCLAGLVIPGLNRLPNQTVIVVLATLMFVSCYQLQEGSIKAIRWRDIFVFYTLRYMMLPVILWLVARTLVPGYATGVFLLSILPAGVSSPAFAAIYGGTVVPAFAIVIMSQILAPFLIPLQFTWIGGVTVAPSPQTLFVTMVWCIFVPLFLYAAFRKHRASNAYIRERNKFFSVLLMAFLIATAISKQRDVILGNLAGLITPLIVTVFCFIVYIAFGWFAVPKRPRDERIAYAACSSFNNAALGVSFALLHFPPPVILLVVVSEIAWALLPMMFQVFLRLIGKI